MARVPSAPSSIYAPIPLTERDPEQAPFVMPSTPGGLGKPLISPNGEYVFQDVKSPDPARATFRSSVALIPTPGTFEKRPPRFEPFNLKIYVVIPGAILLILIGIALEIATGISEAHNGFSVPAKNVFAFASTQFLTSFFPTLVMIPFAFLVYTFDQALLVWQPYVVLSRGNATADESILLNYLQLNRLFVFLAAAKFKHRLLVASTITVLISYLFQPLAGSIFIIKQQSTSSPSSVISDRVIGYNPQTSDLTAFAASAGFASAAVYNALEDPPFVFNGWALAQFAFPNNLYQNGTMAVNTSGIDIDVGCDNPISLDLNTGTAGNFSISAQSKEGCALGPAFFDASATNTMYGVEPVANCPARPETDLEFQPVFFWFYWQPPGSTQHNAAGVFCLPSMQLFDVTAFALLSNGSIERVDVSGNYPTANNVTGGFLNGRVLNGLSFNISTDPNVEARARTVQTTIPNAIFRAAQQSNAGLQAVFDNQDGFLDLTSHVYQQHLALSATSVYFVPDTSSVPSILNQFVPRLVIEPFAAHILAVVTILTGTTLLIVHILHFRARRLVYLSHAPGAIATATAQTGRAGFGELLYPYDDEERISNKLAGLRFRLDRRTGAIVVDDEALFDADAATAATEHARGESFRTLVGSGARAPTMEAITEEARKDAEDMSEETPTLAAGAQAEPNATYPPEHAREQISLI